MFLRAEWPNCCGSALTARYIPGPAIDEPIARADGSTGAKTYFQTNHQGSVIAMPDSSAALAEGPYTYDPCGNCFTGSNPCSAGEPYRFTGRRLDPETGLLYYRARYYDPNKGRFMQTDPVGYTADLNLYAYVGNDPTNRTDPTRDCPWCVVLVPIAVGAGTGAIIDVGFQLYDNGGDIHNINGTEVLESAALGGGLSLLGPTVGMLGRTGARAAEFGFAEKSAPLIGKINNNGILRFGWGWSEEKGASVLRAAGKWIKDLTGKPHVNVPGIAVKGGARPVRDGIVSGTAGAVGAHEARPQSGAQNSSAAAGAQARIGSDGSVQIKTCIAGVSSTSRQTCP